MLNRKLLKFIRHPSLFVYDYLGKRIHGGSSARRVAQDTSLPAPATLPATLPATPPQHRRLSRIDCLLHPPCVLLRRLFGDRSGALSGQPDQSLLLRADQLRLFIGVAIEISLLRGCGLRLHALHGDPLFEIKPGHGASTATENKIFGALNRTTDFVLEFPHLQGLHNALHIFLYQTVDTQRYELKSPQAFIKKFHADELADLYPCASDRADSAGRDGASSRASAPIDIVYTWVNKDDPAWQDQWNATFPEEPCDPDRFTSSDELRYSIRSVLKYAPWVRNIHVVTNCMPPDYLDLTHPRLKWVSHEDIFPDPSVLPTFNSHAIEACLHRVPGLAEQFIYFNDDVFLNQPCYPQHFFDAAGRSIAYLESYGMVTPGENNADTPDYLVAARNSARLLAEVFPHYRPRQLHAHVPHSLRRSVLQELDDTFPDAFARTRAARLRSATDINVTSFLYHHHGLAHGTSVSGQTSALIVRPKNMAAFMTDQTQYRYRFICFNDGGGSSTHKGYKRSFSNFCDRRHPAACELERHRGAPQSTMMSTESDAGPPTPAQRPADAPARQPECELA
ncbi:MAG: hypothetical protein RL489_2856 [Pseudomonadota bacterium]